MNLDAYGSILYTVSVNFLYTITKLRIMSCQRVYECLYVILFIQCSPINFQQSDHFH
jgi:hypothetical protein